MKKSGRGGGLGLLVVGLGLLAVAACQLVAGVQDRSANPIPTGCALPSGNGPPVQFANLVATTQTVDVCLRPTGGSWGEPVLLNGGEACSGSSYFNTSNGASPGFAYAQVSTTFSAPANVVDVEVVAAGNGCSGPVLAQVSGAHLPSTVPQGLSAVPPTTLALIGGNGVAEKLLVLPQSDAQNDDNTRVRFVHAMPGVGPLDFGLGAGAVLPTTLEPPPVVANPVPYGQVPTKGEKGMDGTIIDYGYDNLAPQTYTLVAAVHGAAPEAAILAQPYNQMSGATFSLYAIGIPKSTQFPQRGLSCLENGSGMSTMGLATNNANNNPLLTTCTLTNLPSLSVDVLTTGLYGPQAPNYDARHAYWTNPADNPYVNGSRTADLVCLSQLDFPTDATIVLSPQGLGATGSGTYPYSYWAQASVNTPPTSAVRLDGTTAPSTLGTPPCAGGAMESTEVNQVMQCLIDNCSTQPGNPAGFIVADPSCPTMSCLTNPEAGAAGLATIDYSYPGCLNCLADYALFGSSSFEAAISTCTQSSQPPYGFNGQVPVAILSRYPIVASDTFILPSTNYRQAVSWVRVQLESKQVDFYCGFLVSTLVAGTIEYPPWGFYGNGGNLGDQTSSSAYGQEQLLEAKDLVSWVKSKSGSTPAIVAGEWRASQGTTSDAGVPPADAGVLSPPQQLCPDTMNTLFGAGWTPVVAPNWVPQCNYCPSSENPLNVGQPVSWFTTQPFILNWGSGASSATIDETMLFTDPNAVDLGNGTRGPLSPYFGLNFHVQRPQ